MTKKITCLAETKTLENFITTSAGDLLKHPEEKNREPEKKRFKNDKTNKNLAEFLGHELLTDSIAINNLCKKELEGTIVIYDDNTLEHVEKILINIHQKFYEQYDINNQVYFLKDFCFDWH